MRSGCEIRKNSERNAGVRHEWWNIYQKRCFWALSNILSLGKMQTSLLLPSLIRIFGFAEDTAPRKNASELAFFSRLIRIFDFVLDTLARQNANKFAFALAYSYLCSVCDL